MSTQTGRYAIAQVVDGEPYWKGDTAPGTAFVRLERIEYPNSFGGVAHWNVVVLLPQEPRDAENWLDDRIPALVAAASEAMTVTGATPQRLEIPGVGVLPCVFINGHREAD